MEKVIIIRYSEIHLKGKNRGYFERVFTINIEKALKGLKHEVHRQSGRYLVENFDESKTDEIVSRLEKVFGIHSMSVALKVETRMDLIFSAAEQVCSEKGTFKVETHRADKKFEFNSMQISAEIGGRLLAANKEIKVDVHNPQFIINIDVRENGTTLVFNTFFKGAGECPSARPVKGFCSFREVLTARLPAI